MTELAADWTSILGLSAGLPEWFVAVIVLCAMYFMVILPSAAAVSFLERKLSADLQARIGPNRAGPIGLLQPLADAAKLLQKASRRDLSVAEAFWMALLNMALYSTMAVLPLGPILLLVDTDMSAFVPFWAALVLAFGTMLLGFDQGGISGWLGGVRIAAQTLSGVFPSAVAVVCAAVTAGGFRWSAFIEAQGWSPGGWFVFSSPFLFLAFCVFVLGGLVILGVGPVDSGTSARDMTGGVASKLYGRRLSLFRLGRFYGFFLWSVIAVVLFCGGWRLPGFIETGDRSLLKIAQVFTVLMKTYSLMLSISLLAAVTPRVRADQATDLAFKVLGPLALAALGGTSLWVGMRAFT